MLVNLAQFQPLFPFNAFSGHGVFEGLIIEKWQKLEEEIFHFKSLNPPSPPVVQQKMLITEHCVKISENSSGALILKLEIHVMQRT